MHRKILISFLAMASTFNVGTNALDSVNQPEAANLLLEQSNEYNGQEVFEREEWPDVETIYNHLEAASLADEENSSIHPSLESSHHLGVDRLCSASNTVDNVCTIKDKTLRFSSDLFYKTEKTLIFDNTKIKCLTISYTPCSFMFSLLGGPTTSFEMKNGSVVTGKQIIIGATDSEVKIGNDSSIWASG